MLNDEEVKKRVQKILDTQEELSMYIILTIASQLGAIKNMNKLELNSLKRLLHTGADVKSISKTIQSITRKQIKSIDKLIIDIAESAYNDTKIYFDYRDIDFIPFDDNLDVQKAVNQTIQDINREYINMSRTQAFMVRDTANPKILHPTPASEAYQKVINNAVHSMTSDRQTYTKTITDTVENLVNNGVRYVTYDPESRRMFNQRLDTAVRRNILDGVRVVNQQVQDITGKQFGADGKEITVHRNPAPDHAPIQGHQFTNEEYERLQNERDFEDVNGNKFTAIRRPIGVWNCRHFTYSIILGVMKLNFTQEELDKINAENEAGYTLPNGKHITMYECTQRQRQLETMIRRAKELQMACEQAGDMVKAMQHQNDVDDLMTEYQKFSHDCGLSVKLENIKIPGYKRIK